MTRAAANALAAAETLQAWLETQSVATGRRPAEIADAATCAPASTADADGGDQVPVSRTAGEPPSDTQTDAAAIVRPHAVSPRHGDQTGTDERSAIQALAHTDWLFHRLAVRGPAADLQAFRTAARGAGTIPWQLDPDTMREDFFHLLAAPPAPQSRTLSAAGARILAEELSVAVTRRHAVAAARVGVSQACPFDLHALLPVPPEILGLGPDHPAALAWLWAHWGTTQALRHVTLLANPEETQRLALRFWSADWTPWRAIAALRARWPMLRLDVQPQYDAA